MNIIETIQNFVPNDVQLAQLFDNVQEYTQLYLLAKQRQKGCDGLGVMTNLKEEFNEALEELVEYCKNKGYLPDNSSYDLSVIADEVEQWMQKAKVST
jgi:hypothetical protein